MLPRYLQSAVGFIFGYAVNDIASPDAVLELYDPAKDQAGKPIKCIIAANKCDLPPDQIQVSLTTARDKFLFLLCFFCNFFSTFDQIQENFVIKNLSLSFQSIPDHKMHVFEDIEREVKEM
jgi:hypothetical protein